MFLHPKLSIMNKYTKNQLKPVLFSEKSSHSIQPATAPINTLILDNYPG